MHKTKPLFTGKNLINAINLRYADESSVATNNATASGGERSSSSAMMIDEANSHFDQGSTFSAGA